MELKSLNINVLAILIVVMILISGCTSSPEKPKDTSTCPSPYDGTYSGMVLSSGEKLQGGDMEATESPYILNYNLEVTLKCDHLELCGEKGEQCWFMIPTHAKVSDPYFGCTQGCVPETTDPLAGGGPAYVIIPKPGESGVGSLGLYFKNGKTFTIYSLLTSSDAKTIMADQFDHQKLIENSDVGFDAIRGQAGQEIEEATFRCGSPDCVYQLLGVEMSLSKIS